MKGKNIGVIGLIGLIACGCVSNQELKDWARGVKERQEEKDRQRAQEREQKIAARKQREQDEEDDALGHERRALREQYIRDHPDLDENDKWMVERGYTKIADAEEHRKRNADSKEEMARWEKESENRRAKMEELRKDYLETSRRPEEFKQAVSRHKLMTGMTMPEVLLSLGLKPEHTTRTVFANVETEFWMFGSLTVSFENGIVRSFTEQH